MATVEALMTAEDFGQRPDPGHPEELVQGRIIAMSPPSRDHGILCRQAGFLLKEFADPRRHGRVLSDDSGVITRRGPDSVRGADIAY